MDGHQTTVLMIEDEPGHARAVQKVLAVAAGGRFRLEQAERLGTALERLSQGGVDVILLDLVLPDSQGLDTLDRIQDRAPGMPVVVVTGLDDEMLGLQAVHRGAQDYLIKGQIDGALLARSLRYAIERKRAERRLAAQYAVTRILAESPTLGAAAPRLLEAIGESMGWELGALWIVNPAAQVLRCTELWHRPSVAAADFEAASRQAMLAPGVGLPGRVWASGEPAWVAAGATDADFPRPPAAVPEGRHGAFGFPIRQGNEVFGVIEFISRTIQPPDDDVLAMAAAIGAQVGQLIQRQRAEEALRARHGLLVAVIEGTTDAVFVKDRHGRYLMINSAGARFLGKRVDEVVGKDDTELFSSDTARPIIEADRRVLASGQIETVEDVGTSAGVTRTYLTTRGPYRDDQGHIIGVIGIARDITERKQAEAELAQRARLGALGVAVGVTLIKNDPLPAVLQECAVALVRHLDARLVRIWTLDPAEQVLEIRASVGIDAPPAGTHQRTPVGQAAIGLIAQERRPYLTNSVLGDPRVEDQEWARHAGIVAFAGYPLIVEDQVVGVLAVLAGHPLRPAAFQALGSVADGIAQYIDRKQAEQALRRAEEALFRSTEELRIAGEIQRGLLPRARPALAGFDIAGASWPASAAGGDYSDYLTMPGDCLGIVIADVSGHGLGPALLAASTRAYVRAFAVTQADVSRVLTQLNQALVGDVGSSRFVTLLLARLDPATRSLVYAGAGHPPGYILDGSGAVKAVLKSQGIPLGIEPDSVFAASTAPALEPGDLVLLITDGILETFAPDGTAFGIDRALDAVRADRDQPAGAIVTALHRAIQDFARGMPQRDDVTAVVIKVERNSET